MAAEMTQSIPRIEELTIRNYRALKDVQLKRITPLTVFLGPNGSGKSTIFDVFAFLGRMFFYRVKKSMGSQGAVQGTSYKRRRGSNCNRAKI